MAELEWRMDLATLVPEMIPILKVVDIPDTLVTNIVEYSGIDYSTTLAANMVLKVLNYAMPNDSNVTLEIIADGSTAESLNGAYADGINAEDMETYIVAKERLTVNYRASTATTNVPCRLTLLYDRFSIAEKVLRGETLDGDEESVSTALGIEDLVVRGVVPYSFDAFTKLLFKPLEKKVAGKFNGSISDHEEIAVATVGVGKVGIIEEIRLSKPTTTEMRVNIYRDGGQYLSLNPYASAGYNQPIKCWIPFLDECTVIITTSEADSLKMAMKIRECRVSDYLKMYWRRVEPEKDRALFDLVRAGVISVPQS